MASIFKIIQDRKINYYNLDFEYVGFEGGSRFSANGVGYPCEVSADGMHLSYTIPDNSDIINIINYVSTDAWETEPFMFKYGVFVSNYTISNLKILSNNGCQVNIDIPRDVLKLEVTAFNYSVIATFNIIVNGKTILINLRLG